MKRIICIGNRYHCDDAAGARVYDCLTQMDRPPDVQVIDGGLAGLDLLRFLERTERVVFADALLGTGSHQPVAVLTADDLQADAPETYGHSAGLAYLLRVLPSVADGPLPEISVVGLAPDADRDAVHQAANLCLSLAAGEAPP